MSMESAAPATQVLTVSVIIATFRRPAQVVQAIESALLQGAAVKEVIVVDDCADGSGAEAVKTVQDPRVRYERNPHPTGGCPAVVRNLGWRLSSGSVLHFLDDDDLVPADHYRHALPVFDSEPGIGVVFGRVEPFGEDFQQVAAQRAFFDDAAVRARSLERWGGKMGFATEMTFNPVLYVGGAALIRSRYVRDMGGFDEHIRIIEDTDFFARAMARYAARFIDRVALHYRIGPSITRSPGIEEHVKRGYARLHTTCREEWGEFAFLRRKLIARTVFRRRPV